MDRINSIIHITIHAIPIQNTADHNHFAGAADLPKAQPTTANTIPSINNPIYGTTILGPPVVVIACCKDNVLNILLVHRGGCHIYQYRYLDRDNE